MKDVDARYELEALKRRVLDLEVKIQNLEPKIDRQTHMWNDGFWDYGVGNIYKFRFPVVDVIRMILDHLGLEMRLQAATGERLLLVKKEVDNG